MKKIFRAMLLGTLMVPAMLRGQGCCSGGSGSPIAGGASQGVLQERQMELMANHQYFESNRFFTGDRDTVPLFDNLISNYLYLRAAYGVTKNLTMSIESGYFINKTQYGLDKADTIRSSGIADLIIFPRYDIINRTTESTRTELTLGLGLKIPLGSHYDSTVIYRDPVTSAAYYTTAPPTVQVTNGAHDFIFYTFLFRGFNHSNFRVFANGLYVLKGWNSLGQKFGDYATVGLFASKTFFGSLGVTLQVKGEWIGRLKSARDVDMVALYNVYEGSTGGRSLFFVPQLSYTFGSFTVFGLAQFPVYQYLNGNQVGAEHQITTGLSYRFFVKQPD